MQTKVYFSKEDYEQATEEKYTLEFAPNPLKKTEKKEEKIEEKKDNKGKEKEIPYIKMIAFDLNREKARKVASVYYANDSENGYAILYKKIRAFLENKGFTKIQGSVYKNDKPITKREIEEILLNLKKTYPWISYCMQNCNVSDIKIAYDVTKAVAGNHKSQKEFKEAVIDHHNNDTQKVINFDLVNTKDIPNYGNIPHEVLIPGFIKRGYEHPQQTGYVSKNFKTTLECYKDFINVVNKAPQIKPHMKNATITEVVEQYDGKEFMKLSIKDIDKKADKIDFSFLNSPLKERNERIIYEAFMRRMSYTYAMIDKKPGILEKDIDIFLEAYNPDIKSIKVEIKENKSYYTYKDAMDNKEPPSDKKKKRGRPRKIRNDLEK